jgi:hypothetical protein
MCHTQNSIADLDCTISSQSTKRDTGPQQSQKIDRRAMDALRRKIKAKECEYNILINQLALVDMERKAESKK